MNFFRFYDTKNVGRSRAGNRKVDIVYRSGIINMPGKTFQPYGIRKSTTVYIILLDD